MYGSIYLSAYDRVLYASHNSTGDWSARTVNKDVDFSEGLHDLLEGGNHGFLALPDIYWIGLQVCTLQSSFDGV